ncbi:23S rRNA methylase [Moorella thermoacetica Y72]|uniref:23S rRNA methylase n=1 Tax=Moorella thermoacetica Y72 TaxID=1325331 RepID=A0A0S6UDB2_NEOTH|nr:23S rRNA methylase [Moorella thermoacetica Y72]
MTALAQAAVHPPLQGDPDLLRFDLAFNKFGHGKFNHQRRPNDNNPGIIFQGDFLNEFRYQAHLTRPAGLALINREDGGKKALPAFNIRAEQDISRRFEAQEKVKASQLSRVARIVVD